MSAWGWKPERTIGIWRYGAGWMRPFVAAVPYLTVGLLLLMLHMVGGTLTVSKGIVFDLPVGDLAEGDTTGLVALALPMQRDTILFFDDARYVLGDPASLNTFGEHLSECVSRSEDRTLLVLADRRISGGDLMNLATVAKRNGVSRLLFAEKGAGE